MRPQSTTRQVISVVVVTAMVTVALVPIAAQVRAGNRGAAAKGDHGAVAAGPRGTAVKGEDGYAAAGRRGAVVKGDEGYAAVGRNGNVVTGEEVDVQGAAVGRRGAVVVGEEGAAAVGRYGGVVVGDRYESYDAWRAVAAVGAGIAIGTMLAKPPAAATTVVVSGSTYYVHDNVYYTKVMSSGQVVYQVVEPPAGATISTLPVGCTERAHWERNVHAMWHDVFHEGGERLSGSGPAVTAWRATLPVALLLAVACLQVALARTASLSPWKGGGFGMFSTTDDAGRRHVRVFVSAPDRSEEIAIAPSLEDAALRAAVLPTDGALSRLAERVVAREGRYQRPVDTVRIETWRIDYAPDTLAATSRLHTRFRLPCGRDSSAPLVTRTASPTPSSR